MTRALLGSCLLAVALPVAAQTIAIEGGTVYTMEGPPIEGGTVLVRDGRIVAVGRNVPVPAGAQRIDARGKIVTPGLFESSTHLGLSEVEQVDETNDFRMTDPQDQVTAALRVWDALNPQSIVLPVTRIAGVTTAVVRPAGNLIAGQGAVIDLWGERPEDLVVRAPVAMFAHFGEAAEAAGGGSRAGELLRLREILEDARVYAQRRAEFERGATRDFAVSRLDLEALVPVVQGRLPLAIEAHRAADIRAVLRLADEFGLRLILLGGTEAWQVADELARRRVPVVLKVLQNLPARFEQLGARYDNAALLRRAGVPVAITTNDTHNARNLRQEAGNAVAYGLPWEEALRAITRTPAEVWGVADRYGSLAPGKVANVVVWSGDPLELMTRPEVVLLRGQIVPLRSRQTELRDRYRTLDPSARPYRP